MFIGLVIPVADVQAADPSQIGRSLALNGPFTPYGEAKRDGRDAYIEKINRAGGVNGRAIALTTLDDAYDPKKRWSRTFVALRPKSARQRFWVYLVCPQ